MHGKAARVTRQVRLNELLVPTQTHSALQSRDAMRNDSGKSFHLLRVCTDLHLLEMNHKPEVPVSMWEDVGLLNLFIKFLVVSSLRLVLPVTTEQMWTAILCSWISASFNYAEGLLVPLRD